MSAISANDYIKDLEGKVKKAKSKYNYAKAEASKTDQDYQRANLKEAQLNDYWVRIQATDRLAVDLIATLSNVNTMFSGDMVPRTGDAITAFQILVNDVRDVAEDLEEMKGRVNYLKDCFVAAKIPDGDACKEAVAALSASVDTALKSTLATAQELLGVLKTAESLDEHLDKDYGLYQVFEDLHTTLTSSTPKKHYKDAPCVVEGLTFPLATNDDEKYYKNTEQEYTAAKKAREELAKTLQIKIQTSNSAKASLDSLEAALKAAKEANTCATK